MTSVYPSLDKDKAVFNVWLRSEYKTIFVFLYTLFKEATSDLCKHNTIY